MHTPGPLNKSLKELRSRLEYVNSAWTPESYEQLLQFFVGVIPKLLDAERASIFVIEPETGQITSMFGTLIANSAIQAPLEGSVVGAVVSSGTPVIDNELVGASGYHQTVDAQTGFHTRNVICTPIKGVTTGRVTGAVEVLNKLSDRDFGDDDLELLNEVAAYLSVALDNILITGEIRRISQDLNREVAKFQSGYLGDLPFVAESQPMRDVLELVRMVCDTPVNVLIQGENGTGKEVIARMIHEGRDRRARAFVPVNCAAIPEHLMESEFFGYEKGAFTGAVSNRKGRFEEAKGGTLFLDEIGDIPMSMQPKFLRAVQEGEGVRLGSNTPVSYDFSIISATNKNLRELVDQGLFRQDLFYRLFAVEIVVPPLRNRREDIASLSMAFIEDVCRQFDKPTVGVSGELIEAFERYPWPGNVRQLRREIERLVALTPPGEALLLERCSPEFIQTQAVLTLDESSPLSIPSLVEELEVKLIRTAIERTGGNKVGAAKLLGITRQGLHKKLKRYELDSDGVKAT